MTGEQEAYTLFQSRFKNRQYIGSGGFAQVYKVFDHAKNHYVALKMADVKPEWEKFTLKNEVELVNKLDYHRNIARYDACYRFDTGITGLKDFAILKFYEYGNLEQFLLNEKEKLTVEDKGLIIRGILDGVAFLHNNNVIHRDLKAQNILLHREDGIWTPKITDFGLSRQVVEKADITNSAIGMSYAYAAPEQIQNHKIDTNVDLWAVGVIIYRVIANELPFKGSGGVSGKSTQSQLELSEKITKLELPSKLEGIQEPFKSMIKRCLILNPKERVQTAEELIEILHKSEGFIRPQVVPVINNLIPVNPAPLETEIIATPEPVVAPIPVDLPLDAEATVIIADAAPVSTPVSSPIEDEATAVITPENSFNPYKNASPPMPEDYRSSPEADYSAPNSNPTQINLVAPRESAPPPPPVTHFEPTTGDQKKFNWWWVLLPLILISLGLGSWWVYENKASLFKNEESIPPPVKPTPVKKLERFSALDKQNNRVRKSKRALGKIQLEIETNLTDSNAKNYRVNYILAKNQTYLVNLGDKTKIRPAFNTLALAVKIAITNNQVKEMLNDLEKDEAAVFVNLKKVNKGKPWKGILQNLEKQKNKN